jgi:hypothetical protein
MKQFLAGCLAVLAIAAPHRAAADYHIFSPYEIDLGELEIEHNGDAVFDRRPDQTGAMSETLELGTGLTPWWHSEIEFGAERAPGPNQPDLLTQLVTENTFELTEPGEYPADLGFYAEYGQSTTRGPAAAANEITFGPLIAKDIGRTTETINLFLTRQLGPDETAQGLDFSYAAQSRWNLWTPLSPAVELYGDAGTLGASPRFARQQLLAGPVGIGAIRLASLGLGHGGQFKYELGWLFGATPATQHSTLRWRFELEIPF